MLYKKDSSLSWNAFEKNQKLKILPLLCWQATRSNLKGLQPRWVKMIKIDKVKYAPRS